MRKNYSFISDKIFIQKALQFANRETSAVYLNPNSYDYPNGAFKHVLAFGSSKELKQGPDNNFYALQNFLKINKDWTFGYFTYELKNETEQLSSKNTDLINFPLLNFFIPKHLIFFDDKHSEIHSEEDPEKLYQLILQEQIETLPSAFNISLQQKISKDEYLKKIKILKEMILKGDLYEINFCQEYFALNADINPLSTYLKLNEISPMPFSCYLKMDKRYLLCASPERFIKKEKTKLISQPIKGTAKRDTDPNDLSRSALPGSVKVEEICGVYTFPKVHQMISTISAELSNAVTPVEAIKNAFPMGSMTGAPKVSAMQVIDKYEESVRGLFSGSVGYFTPDMDFDFNVVIRSILYNAETKYLSFQAGSAITHYADPEKEYEECGIKTAAIREVLQGVNRNSEQ